MFFTYADGYFRLNQPVRILSLPSLQSSLQGGDPNSKPTSRETSTTYCDIMMMTYASISTEILLVTNAPRTGLYYQPFYIEDIH